MARNTEISWADSTFNAWMGCTKVGPGCDGCYAEAYAERFKLVEWGPGKPRHRTSIKNWAQPLLWHGRAVAAGQRPWVFLNSLSDVWDNEVDPKWRAELFELMRLTPSLVWLLLSKRIGNAAKMAADAGGLPDNAAVGATMVNQDEVDRDMDKLLTAPAGLFKFISYEPALGPVRFNMSELTRIAWVIAGGESGRAPRVPNPQWFRDLRDQCHDAGAVFHFKQWGEWGPDRSMASGGLHRREFRDDQRGISEAMYYLGKERAGFALDGKVYRERPSVPAIR